MLSILFRPFDAARWFTIGFSAWLSKLAESGGGGGGGFNWNDPAGRESIQNTLKGSAETAREWIRAYGPVLIAAAAVVVVMLVVFGLTVAWLSARGKFMFLDNVLTGKARITHPWRHRSRQGNSLFLWNIAFGATLLLALLFIICAGAASILPYAMRHTMPALAVCGGSAAALLLLVLLIAAGYTALFCSDFVVPIMYRDNVTILAGWRTFISLLRARPAFFTVYGIARAMAGIAIGGMLLGALFLGMCCCCVSLLALIPYLGTVLLLPVHVFDRALGPEYLAEIDGNPIPVAEPPAVPTQPCPAPPPPAGWRSGGNSRGVPPLPCQPYDDGD